MSVGPDSFDCMSRRWGREQVLGLAPDASARKAAGGVAEPARWDAAGCDDQAVWGECQGSGSSRYRACVDLAEPAFRCSCPSRKFPCKHALGLLLLWSEERVDAGSAPGWAAEWLTQRQQQADQRAEQGHGRAAQAGARVPSAGGPPRTADPRTAQRREQRVAAGLEEFGRWLRDQVARGLAQAETAPYSLWDDAARRLIDAQAGALAGQVKALASIPRQRAAGGAGIPPAGTEWPARLLEEYALLHLLIRAYARQGELPEALRETVRSRIGFTVSQEEVLRGPTVRDHWYVAGVRDSEQDRLLTRRAWLRGRDTGRPALVLSFAAPGRALDATLMPGATLDAELAFFPGAQPLRALVADRYGMVPAGAPPGTSVGGLLAEYAEALSRDPWLDRWPAVLADVRLSRDRQLVDEHGDALPLDGGDHWRLLALSGGGPVTVGGEWTPRGLLALTAWHKQEGVVPL